jgi:hypothetical protein
VKQQALIKFIALLAPLVFSCISFSSWADEAALYDLAPKGSAFLRIINLREHSSDRPYNNRLTLRIQNKHISTDAYCSASEFIYVTPGEYRKKINGLQWEGTLEPDKAYALVVEDNSVRLLKDYRAQDSRRAVLAVHNFSKLSQLDLETATSARSVFENIPQGGSVARAINPLKSAFSVIQRTAGKKERITVTDPMIFQSGVLSSLFICGDQSELVVHWADRMGNR